MLDSEISSHGFIRCQRCKGQLLSSGVEVHRYICQSCGQNYHAVLYFDPVEPINRSQELLSSNAGGSATSEGGRKVPTTLR